MRASTSSITTTRDIQCTTKDEMEQTACVEFPPWNKRGSDFAWDPEIDIFEVFGYVNLGGGNIADLDASRRDLVKSIF